MQTLEKVLYHTTVISAGGRDGKSRSTDEKLNVKLSTPVELGGKGGDGTNPEQLFAAGYSACFLGALKLAASREKITLPETTQITAEVSLGPISTGFGISVELKIDLPGIAHATATQLVEKAHVICPYSNATRGNISVNLQVL